METEKLSYLLSSEIMSHKVLLQFLIGVVDAQLLQVVDMETLKPVHVQDSWRSEGGALCELLQRT